MAGGNAWLQGKIPPVNTLDLIIGLFALLLVWRGARTGFLAGTLSLVGVLIGAALGSRVAPLLLNDAGSLLIGPVLTLVCIVAFAVLGDAVGRTVGGALRDRLVGPAGTLDSLGGAAVGLTLALLLVWAAGLLALQSQALSPFRPAVEESRMLQALNQRIPPGLFAQAVAQFDRMPQFENPGGLSNSEAPPDAAILADPEVQAAASRIVRVTGLACGYGIEGSGWIAAPNLVVTNAHVVAGEMTTRVQPGGNGRRLPAQVVLFDVKNDIAILRAPGLDSPPLESAEPRNNDPVAILGYPENGPYDMQPGRVGSTRLVISGDAYNRGPVERVVTSFNGHVRPGNSGGPAVNADGDVVATIFASRADSDNAGYGVPSTIVNELIDIAAARSTPVSTGECAA